MVERLLIQKKKAFHDLDFIDSLTPFALNNLRLCSGQLCG